MQPTTPRPTEPVLPYCPHCGSHASLAVLLHFPRHFYCVACSKDILLSDLRQQVENRKALLLAGAAALRNQ